MQLRPGIRLESVVCDAQVVVVKAPAGVELDVRCGGEPMHEMGTGDGPRAALRSVGDAAQLGKRYASDEVGLELLCTRAGDGTLCLGEAVLPVKGAKPLPASD